MRLAAACHVLTLLAVSGLTFAGDWPCFRGPTALGYVSEKDGQALPLTWGGSKNENVLWKAPLPKNAGSNSSPIVVKDRVIVTIVANEPVEHRVLCFQKGDGKPLWDTPVKPGPLLLKDTRGGYGAPTPTSDGNFIYAVFGSAVIACLDLDGKIKWRTEFKEYAFDVAIGGSPVLYKDTVIFLCDFINKSSHLIAFDARTGEPRWKTPRPEVNFSHTTPTVIDVSGTPQLVVCSSNVFQGYEPGTGKLIWWCAARGDVSVPAYGAGVIYCDDGRGGYGTAVRPTGKGDVTKTHLAWKDEDMKGELGSPIIVGDYLYRLGPQKLMCLKAATGEKVYSEKLSGISTWASLVATADGRIYAASAGKSYVVKAGPKFETIGGGDLGDPCHASPAVSEGKLFLRGNRAVYCIGTK
jgi:outer membrane protein assembly factor BamB